MKKIAFIFILIFSVSVSARTFISAEENSTLVKLTNWGIVSSFRTEKQLNQPLSAIDSMSLQIKAMKVQEQWYNDFFQDHFSDLSMTLYDIDNRQYDLQTDQELIQDRYDDLVINNLEQKRKIEDNFWLNIGFSILCLGVGLIL